MLDVGEDGTADFTFDRSTFTAIEVNAKGGDDRSTRQQRRRVRQGHRLDGGAGDDTLRGGAGDETLHRRRR